MTVITKYDYCQACHLLLTECRCNATLQAETITGKAQETPIWLSTWVFDVTGTTVKISGVVVKGTTPEQVKANPLYLKRATRTLHQSAKVITVTLDTKLGYGTSD